MTEVIKTNLKAIIISALVAFTAMFASLAITTSVNAQSIDKNVKCGSNIDLDEQNCTVSGNSTKLEDLIKTIINIFSAVVGAVSVIMLIVGGFRYITSAGDSNNVGAAKNTILYAIVGLVIVVVAQIIVQFVLERTTT